MRYWCPECKSEYTNDDPQQDICCGRLATKLPDFETPEQYEKRTGKRWNGAIWFRSVLNEVCEWSCTSSRLFEQYKNLPQEIDGVCEIPEWQVLCANSPEPPLSDFIPKEDI